jgi:hypothetical protein
MYPLASVVTKRNKCGKYKCWCNCFNAPHERARKRRNRFWGALAGVFLALVASASAVYAWQQLKTN